MAWVATADFNGLTTATLNGQGGGSGWSANWGTTGSFNPNNWTVQATTVYEGAKAITCSTGATIERTLTTTLSGDGNIMYFAMRASGTFSDIPNGLVFRASGDATRVKIDFNTNGNITLEAGASTITLVSSYAANTWYVFRVTLNVTSNTCTVASSTGAFGSSSTFGADSAPITMAASGNIDGLYPSCQGGASIFLDYISDTSPFTTAPVTSGNFLPFM